MVEPISNQPAPIVHRRVVVPEKAPGLLADRFTRSKKALEALAGIGNTNDGAPDPTNKPVDLTAYDHHSSFWANRARRQAALQALAANRQAEQAAKFPSYDRLRNLVKHDPMAERALQAMLIDGRLQAVLPHLNAIATQELARGVDRKELLRTLVQELEDPNSISQGDGDIGTCVATTATIAAAYRNPGEVARIVAGLASKAGRVEIDGDVLQRPANWNVDTKGFGGQRSPAVKLMQPALMNFALRENLRVHREALQAAGVADPDALDLLYDPRTDAFTPSGSPDQVANGGIAIAVWKQLNEGGLDNHQGNVLLERLTGGRYQPYDVNAANRAEVFARVAAAVKAGHKVPVGVTYTEDGHEGGHQMMVHSYDARSRRYRITDPIDGGIHRWSEAKLQAAITDANVPLE